MATAVAKFCNSYKEKVFNLFYWIFKVKMFQAIIFLASNRTLEVA